MLCVTGPPSDLSGPRRRGVSAVFERLCDRGSLQHVGCAAAAAETA